MVEVLMLITGVRTGCRMMSIELLMMEVVARFYCGSIFENLLLCMLFFKHRFLSISTFKLLFLLRFLFKKSMKPALSE